MPFHSLKSASLVAVILGLAACGISTEKAPEEEVVEPQVEPVETAEAALAPAGTWNLTWADEFNGASGSPASSNWLPGPSWAAGPRPGTHKWRDAVQDPSECYHDGLGSLVLRARMVGSERRACYLTTGDTGDDKSRWKTFGPGANGTYIEFRANVSKFRAHASWFAMWLMSPTGTYDGNPSTGTEVDVMEYVPFVGPNYSLLNLFHSGVFWDLSNGRTQPPQRSPFVDAYGQVSAPAYGADLTRDEFHTWGIEWYAGLQRFYFDGKMFWENRAGVSSANNHAIRLTVEIANGNPYNLWGHPVGAFEANPAANLPATARVDYVRVYSRAGGSAPPPPPPPATSGQPTPPTNLRGSVYSRTAGEIFWGAATDDGQIVKYDVYRNGQLKASKDARSYYDPNLTAGTTYAYEVIAVDDKNNRSAPAKVSITANK